MDSLRGMISFVTTAQTGSFARAARTLAVSPVAVSKNVARLERQLGVRLLQRSTRKLALTREGEAFLEQCAQPLRELAEAQQRMRERVGEAAGPVRVTAVSPFVHGALAPILPEFAECHPAVRLEIHVSETPMDMIGGRFDVGIRVGALHDAAYVARKLGPLRFVLCAAPAYLKAHGVPRAIADLAAHRALRLQRDTDERPADWALASAHGRIVLPVQGPLVSNDLMTLLQACIAGAGLAQLPLPMALPALRAGQLRVVLPESTLEGLQLYVHYPSRRHMPSRVRVFVEFVVEKTENHPDFLVDPGAFAVRTRALR